MSKKTPYGHSKKILLVENDAHARGERAVILTSHGYEMLTAGTAADARVLWDDHRPDLIVFAITNQVDGILQLWEEIRRVLPQQPIVFLHSKSISLCPVWYHDELVRPAEDHGGFVGRVRAALVPHPEKEVAGAS